MAEEFVPDEALGRIARETGLSGSTLPRYILDNLGWPQALIEDYDAKGRNLGQGNDDIVSAAEGALTAQRWARTNQQMISGLASRVSVMEAQVARLDIRVSANADNIATNAGAISVNALNIGMNSAAISALSDRVSALEAQVPMLQPKTGTVTPENTVESNLSRTYYRIDGSTMEIYFNPQAGVNTGWTLMT